MVDYVGTDSNDYIDGGFTSDDSYSLGAGNDTVFNETAGYDTYIGGTGDDFIYDAGGNDAYIFNIGDGHDSIVDLGGLDVIRFGEGINKANTAFSRVGDDVVINLRENATDSITITNWFMQSNYDFRIETIEFADGTSYEAVEVENIIDGLLVVGTDYSDSLIGDSRDNTLIGYLGNDVYTGGTGNDTIIDDAGNEVYNFSAGDGQDTISDYAGTDVINFNGISKNAAIYTQDGNNLVITFQNSTDQITISNWYLSDSNKIETLHFADGDVLSGDIGTSPVLPDPTIVGTDGADVLFGTLGDDTIAGGKGFDIFHDHGGSDTYLFNKGDGTDSIFDMSLKKNNSDVDTALFGADVQKTDVAFYM
ncbi:MAG TPA: hypothetical protein DDX14_09110, partial [Cyanobacteria bacterium UBA9579]|nr:hypothetical protein [Cyanobacteria bacterium UBA9579]